MNTKPIILKVPAFEDFRGYLAVPYDQSINFTVRQINQGYSKKKSTFTLRTESRRHSATSGTEATARWSRSGMPLRMRRTARTF